MPVISLLPFLNYSVDAAHLPLSHYDSSVFMTDASALLYLSSNALLYTDGMWAFVSKGDVVSLGRMIPKLTTIQKPSVI